MMIKYIQMNIMALLQRGRTRIQEIYTSFKNRSNEIDCVEIDQKPDPQLWSFQVHFKQTRYSLSIAVPADMMVGYCETALFSEGTLVYRDDWGYQDVNRFSDVDELVREIIRIGKLAHANDKQP